MSLALQEWTRLGETETTYQRVMATPSGEVRVQVLTVEHALQLSPEEANRLLLFLLEERATRQITRAEKAGVYGTESPADAAVLGIDQAGNGSDHHQWRG